MPVSTGTGPSHADRAKRCRHCEESGHRLDNGTLFWRIHLDQDLFDTIIAIYPEWFKDYNVNRAPTMAEGGSGSSGASPEPGPAGPAAPAGPGGPAPPGHAAPAASPALASRGPLPLSPPKAEVDESPLQKSMDKNKESLKVKLMLRRPINQLVAQGIMPPLKTPPAFHEQRQKLERAKMGDLLKAKIQQRPDRQELVRQHILEDVGHVDPSLAERQRMLKKARLADSLNDQLSHRPGPLELIKKNILHTEEPIERAVKEGVIPFKATSEGQVTKPQHPNRYITFEEDSQSSEGAQSPLQTQSTSIPEVRSQPDVLEAAAASAGIVTVALTIPTAGGAVVVTSATPTVQHQSLSASSASTVSVSATPVELQPPQSLTFADLCNSVVGGSSHGLAPAPSPMSLGSTTSSLSPLSSISVSSPPAPPTPSPTVTITPRPAPQPSPISVSSQRSDAPGKDKNRKKSKSKAQPKTRTIKFHEYKGPPNAHKTVPINASPVETSYELLLQQQQLFLQWQLEWQHKYPQIILPASQKPIPVNSEAGNSQQSATPALSGLIAVASPASTQHTTSSIVPSPTAQPATPAPALPIVQSSLTQSSTPVPSQDSSTTQSLPTFRALTKLEDMKVSDLKAELKRRNLPVSGSKPQLIERLKPYSEASHQPDSQNNQNNQNNQTTSTTIPMSHMGHIIMDTHGSVLNEESLSGLSMDTPVSPPIQQMSLTVENSIAEDDVSLPNLSPGSEQQQLSPLSPTMSPDGTADMEMDTSDGNFAASSLNSPAGQSSPQPSSPAQSQTPMSEEIIRDQQRKIEELQRELLRSQLQLQKIRSKEFNNPTQVPQTAQKTPVLQHKLLSAGMTVSTTPNGIVMSSDITPKQHQKMILQQHLQQKKQQQQLQQQIQALQQQHLQQQQLQQPQQQKQVTIFQQQPQTQQQLTQTQQQQQETQLKQQALQQTQQTSLQQSHCSFPSQQGLSAKASLAAFLQNQSQQNQQLTNLLHQESVASNNKNNNCTMVSNNKKNMASKNIVLGQQQTAIVLNQLNLQKQKTAAPNGIVGHQRTSSLPNFFGSFLSQQQQQAQSSVQSTQSSADNQKSSTGSMTQTTTEPQLLITKPPPQYEEATKQLKVKQEIPSDCAAKSNSRSKNVKSQMMDDVLEILIKNGELPPSAAQDPATPTTPGRSLPHGLIFTASTTATTSTTTTTTSTSTVNSSVDNMVSSPPAPPPPPPPPPPLPHTTFAITLPTSITLTTQQDGHESNSSAPFHMQFTGPDTFEFLLGSAETTTSNRSQAQVTHPSPILTSDLQPPPGIDLKELGLDLETLDSMDFGNFGDLCAPVKMTSPNLLETVTDMEIGGSGDPAHDQSITPKEEMLHDQLMNQQPCELMDIGEMPMDMDEADWLESLMPSDQNANGNVENSSVMTPPHHSVFNIPTSTGSSCHFNHNNVDLDSYDPLLSNSQDPFDLFNIEDPDFKMSADLNALGWDKVDFAT